MATARKEAMGHLSLGVAYVYGADIKGDIAEFGVENGDSALAIANALGAIRPKLRQRKLHLFDSFQGFPRIESKVDLASPHVASGRWQEGTCCSRIGEKGLLKTLKAAGLPRNRVQLYRGWFKETLLTIQDGSVFAMLHIDCDLYQSAMDVLEGVFGRGLVARGAVLFFDDWNCNNADPGCGERRAWADIVRARKIIYSDEGPYSWNGRKFIVHAYDQLK